MTTDPLRTNSINFKVTLIGIRKDMPIEKVRDEFSALLKTTPSSIDRVFTLIPYTLKKNIRFDQAIRYKTVIENSGGICHIEEDSAYVTTKTETLPPTLADSKPQATAITGAQTPTALLDSAEILPHHLASKDPKTRISRKIVMEIRKFLLLDIPERSITLNFKLPSPSARAKVGSASSADLYDSENDPLEFFRLHHTRIKFLNFANLSMGARLRANRNLITIFYSPATNQLMELAKTGGVPEPEDSRQLLILVSDIASILITSYALVFASYYEGSKYHYARNRKKVLELASSIFELLLLKQRARALRYQNLDPSDWSMANTVFHVMWAYEDVELPIPKRVSGLNMHASRGQRSLSDQFILLQVCAWFDMLRLPTTLQWVIGSYLLKVENAVQIKKDDGTLNTNERLVYCYGKQAAETKRLNVSAGPILTLNFHDLVEAMHQDCQAKEKLNVHDASYVMPRFAHFETSDHFVIRNQFLSRLNFKKEYSVSSDIQQVDDLRIFVGFSAIFAMLRHQRSEFASEKRLEDSFSKRSAVFAVDGREIRQSLWSFSFQSESMTRFTTTEGKETTAMGIGMLLAYGAGEEVHRPRLAIVSKIARHTGKILEIDMRFIANFCEPVIISFNSVKVIGLMIYDSRNGGRWSLAFAPRDVLIGVDKVELHRNQKVTPVTLTAILDASRDFYLLDTTLTSSQLGFYSEPQYPAAVKKQAIHRIY
jgi:hypothetical protein